MKGGPMTHKRRTKWNRLGAATAEVLLGFFAVIAVALCRLLVSTLSLVIRMVRNADLNRSTSVRGREGIAGQPQWGDHASLPAARFETPMSDAGAGTFEPRDERLEYLREEFHGESEAVLLSALRSLKARVPRKTACDRETLLRELRAAIYGDMGKEPSRGS